MRTAAPKLLEQLVVTVADARPRDLWCFRGPTLQLLGTREPAIYGKHDARATIHATLEDARRGAGAASIAGSRTTRVSSSTGSGAAGDEGFAGVLHQRRRAHPHVARALRRHQGDRRCPASRCTSRTPRRARRYRHESKHRRGVHRQGRGIRRATPTSLALRGLLDHLDATALSPKGRKTSARSRRSPLRKLESVGLRERQPSRLT